MNKKYFKLQGRVVSVSDLVHVARVNIPDLYKRIVTIETIDSQIIFFELRNKKLKLLEREQIELNSIVDIEYSFEGSEKNGKQYNNVYIYNIKRISI